MTKIHLHGKISKKFGKLFELNIDNVSSALNAIDSNREGFLKEIKKMSIDGFNYFVLIDNKMIENKEEFIEKRKIENIHLIPAISGSGVAIAAAIGFTGIGAQIAGFVINMAISAAVSLGVNYIMNQLNKQAQPPQQHIAVGGGTAMLEAAGKSYIFNNLQNISSQGDSIPIGYGRYKLGTKVISVSVKDYATNQTYTNEFSNNTSLSVFTDFLTS
jgi:predicted phage tail protein